MSGNTGTFAPRAGGPDAMRHLAAALAVLVVQTAAGPARSDEIDDLVRRLQPPARFGGYKPSFRAVQRTFTFHHVKGPETKQWWVIMDGDKYVALHRSGDFNLIALTPDLAGTTLRMPAGRYHLDTQLGPTLCTHQFLAPVKVHGSIYSGAAAGPKDEWIAGDNRLTLARSFETEGRIARHRFVLSVDPVFGYRIDGHYDVRFREAPKQERWVGPTFCPGCYVPWPGQRIYDRTVYCPGAGLGGYRGWANNLLCMDRCDADRKKFCWRDGGFIAHLNPRSGWSVCRTRQDGGGDVSMALCNAHNDFHVWIDVPEDLPKDERGWYRFQGHHRLLALPPELTRHVWDHVELIQQGAKGVFVSIGEVEGFEDQPKPLTEPRRGLTWTSGAPAVVSGEARSGGKSLFLKGSSWPNLPQVSCLPEARYRLEAYFKVLAWTQEEAAAARQKDQDHREKLQKRGQPLPPETDWDHLAPEAYITAHMYEWSPHSRKWLLRQQTTKATAEQKGWQRVVLEFETPKWDPFVNIVFEVRSGKAYMDDFSLMQVKDARAAAPGVKAHPATEEELERLGCAQWPTWTCQPKTFRRHYDRTETCYITEGEAAIDTAVGSVTLEPGHLVVLPKGLECTWQVRKAVKKHYRSEAPPGE